MASRAVPDIPEVVVPFGFAEASLFSHALFIGVVAVGREWPKGCREI